MVELTDWASDAKSGSGLPPQEAMWIGLLGWLAACGPLQAPAASAGHESILSLDRWTCAAFQIGVLPQRKPFLAYPADLWWFDGIWQGAAAGAAGLVLVADYTPSFALLLPGEWPKTLAEYARICARFGEIALCPVRPEAIPAVSDGDELDSSRMTPLPYLESGAWLEPLLSSL